jgi:hypothetical protein
LASAAKSAPGPLDELDVDELAEVDEVEAVEELEVSEVVEELLLEPGGCGISFWIVANAV